MIAWLRRAWNRLTRDAAPTRVSTQFEVAGEDRDWRRRDVEFWLATGNCPRCGSDAVATVTKHQSDVWDDEHACSCGWGCLAADADEVRRKVAKMGEP